MTITSPAFKQGARIPDKYTSVGENINPPLEWSHAPPGTKQFVLVCFDPDAPLPRGFDHWVLYGIPAEATSIPEGGGTKGLTQGLNGMGKEGYTGPAPPQGHGTHHYFFWIYALDTALKLEPGLDKDRLIDSIEGHVLEQARLVGLYER